MLWHQLDKYGNQTQCQTAALSVAGEQEKGSESAVTLVTASEVKLALPGTENPEFPSSFTKPVF